ncbi:restriction endonuclease [Streptodolium elevatio]|uniref:Restriction endonuclease n=1 Tax=Streptodolium elevatio TaxID=3157996 RepID=A0ABV3DFR5_9ACTN
MTTFYQARLGAYLKRAERGTDARMRGRYYENLLDYLISAIPGCQAERNTLNYYGTEEVDITVANTRPSDGLRLLPEFFVVECKNWSSPVDSTTLGYFVNVVVDRGCSLGILAAANGITGHQEHRTRAHAIGAAALVRQISILVVTSDDLRRLSTPKDMVELLHRRRLSLTARGSIFLG